MVLFLKSLLLLITLISFFFFIIHTLSKIIFDKIILFLLGFYNRFKSFVKCIIVFDYSNLSMNFVKNKFSIIFKSVRKLLNRSLRQMKDEMKDEYNDFPIVFKTILIIIIVIFFFVVVDSNTINESKILSAIFFVAFLMIFILILLLVLKIYLLIFLFIMVSILKSIKSIKNIHKIQDSFFIILYVIKIVFFLLFLFIIPSLIFGIIYTMIIVPFSLFIPSIITHYNLVEMIQYSLLINYPINFLDIFRSKRFEANE